MVAHRTVEARWVEFVVLYALMPVVSAVAMHRYNYRGAMAPLLWLCTLVAGVVLFRDPGFDSAVLWRLPLDHPYVYVMLRRFCFLGLGLLAVGRWLTPEGFLWLPRKKTSFWFLFLFAYPLLSAVPQGMLWRVLLVHRYAVLFPERNMLLLVGAAAFSLAHLAFWNRTALIVTAIGGALFLSTYLHTQSMWLAALEHGAYGVVAFSAGLGTFLYRGAQTASAQTATAQRG